jgi:hypothetical protein
MKTKFMLFIFQIKSKLRPKIGCDTLYGAAGNLIDISGGGGREDEVDGRGLSAFCWKKQGNSIFEAISRGEE